SARSADRPGPRWARQGTPRTWARCLLLWTGGRGLSLAGPAGSLAARGEPHADPLRPFLSGRRPAGDGLRDRSSVDPGAVLRAEPVAGAGDGPPGRRAVHR